ncbi:hypothetical protein P9112_011284 [Eukaryota sp. TZLM1-RC]
MTFIFSADPRILSFFENMPSETRKRHAMAVSASYSSIFISLRQQLEKHCLRLDPAQQLLMNPFKHFNKKRSVNLRSKPKNRHSFDRPGKGHVYEKLERTLHHGRHNHALPTSRPLQQLVDAKCPSHNYPTPATFACSVLHNNTNFGEPLLSWFNTHHTMAFTLFNFLVSDAQKCNTLLSSRRVTLNQGNSTYIFRCGLTIQNHLEQAFPLTFRRQRLTPISGLKPAFVPFSTEVLNDFISKNTSQTILKTPY